MSFLGYSGPHLVIFINMILALACSLCILIGLYPFKGLFHAWLYKNYTRYDWSAHTMMGWFEVGCIGLFCMNLQALLFFTETTGQEAYRLVYITNAVMHFLWGAHNLHHFIRHVRKVDMPRDEWRRPWATLLWSLLGACGTGVIRNVYTAAYGINDTLILVTWIIEWLCLALLLTDLGYHLTKEHKWGMAMLPKGAESDNNHA